MDIVFSQKGPVGHILLSREKALNALTKDMALQMKSQLESWARDDSITSIIVEGAGEKAFCAGGDIRALYENGQKHPEDTVKFFEDEYNLNALISYFPKPYIALLNGITMGGGVGISAHGNHTIVTEKCIVSMPETTIGFIPDVGTTFILSRAPGNIGAYLAMSGARMDAADAIYAGFAKHYVRSENLDALKNDLANGSSWDEVRQRYADDPGTSKLDTLRDQIDAIFSGDDPKLIMRKLKKHADQGDEWAIKLHGAMTKMSPLAIASALHSVRRAESYNVIEECLTNEFRFASRALIGTEFYEGIRALIVDKDNKPSWQPSDIEDVAEKDIDALFSSLGDQEWQYEKYTF